MFELIKSDTNIDFIGKRNYAYAFSIALCGLCFLLALVWGPRYGIDFAGGTLLHVRFHQPVDIGAVRNALSDLGDVSVQEFGTIPGEYLLRLPESGTDLAGISTALKDKLDKTFGEEAYEVLRTETVGPRVGNELREKALLAVLFSTIMMGIYVALRFEIRFGIGAAVALAHDVIVTVGALILFQYDFDLTIIAALLTIVGFSVNDTVVISDRVRENMRKNRRTPLAKLLNDSINQTLSRTILTTGTALLVTITLYLLGGSVIHGFAFALLVGFVTGTYSTVFVAGAIVLAFEREPAAAQRQRRAAST